MPVLMDLMSTFWPVEIVTLGFRVMLNIRNCSEAMAPTLPSLGQYTCVHSSQAVCSYMY